MKINIIKLKKLNRKQTRMLSALVDSCNAYDDTHYGYPLDADAYYLLYEDGRLTAVSVLFLMGEHLNCKELYELAAFTAPEKRRRAHYSRLMAAMKPRLKGSYVRYAIYENAAALGTLKARKAAHSHDELMLSLELCSEGIPSPNGSKASDWQGDSWHDEGRHDEGGDGAEYETKAAGMTVDSSAEHNLIIAEDCANSDENGTSYELSHESGHARNRFGECYFRIDKTSGHAYVFGVQTYANYLRQGHAYRLLSSLYRKLKLKGVKTVTLQVSSDNEPALKLYGKLGMQESERLCLYTEQL